METKPVDSPTSRATTPGETSSEEDHNEIPPAPVRPDIRDVIDKKVKLLETQKSSLGWLDFKGRGAINDQIKTLQEVPKVIDQIEITLGGIPLDHETKQILGQLAETKPDVFNTFKTIFVPLEPNENLEMRCGLVQVNIASTYFKDTEMLAKLSKIFADLSITQVFTRNTQFNTDQLDGNSQRRENEINRFQGVLAGNPDAQVGTSDNMLYIDDPKTIEVQKQHIESAQNWAQQNGFQNTKWWPGGLSGRGMLFCADFDPIEQTQGGPLKVSRHL